MQTIFGRPGGQSGPAPIQVSPEKVQKFTKFAAQIAQCQALLGLEAAGWASRTFVNFCAKWR
jgi:hypothetical protein